MPRIPTYDRKQSVPGVGGNVPMNNSGIVAAKAMGNAVQGFTNEFADLVTKQAEDIRQRDITMMKWDNTHKAKKYVMEEEGAYSLNANKTNNISNLTDYSNDRNKKFPLELRKLLDVENIKYPEVRQHAEEIIGNLEEHFYAHTSMEQAKIRKAFADKQIGEGINIAIASVMNGAPIEESIKDAEKMITEFHNTGTLNLDQATDKIIQAQHDTAKAGLEYMAVNNPQAFKEAIKSGKYNKFLTTEEYKGYQHQSKTIDHDEMLTTTYATLYEKNNGDFNKMNEELSKPEVQKQLGLTLQDTFYIKNQISNAQTDKDKNDNIRWSQNAKNVFLNLKNISPGEIDRMVARGDLSYQLGEHFKTEKQQIENMPSDPWAWYRAYNSIKDSAGDPDAMTKVKNNIMANSSISMSDKKHLLEMTEKDTDQHESQIEKKGLDYIKAVVMPSQTMLTAAKPMEAQKFLEAGIAYDKALEAARKNGEKITGDVVERISKEIANTYSMTVYDQMDAVKKKMEEDKRKKNAPKSNQPYFDVTVKKAPYAGAKLTDSLVAANYIKAANGNKDDARKLAKADGWVF